MVLNLNINTIEADLILQGITGRKAPPTGVLAPLIQQTPINKASGRERIFAMAFPTLYPTGRADLNTPRLRNVGIKDYARHMLC